VTRLGIVVEALRVVGLGLMEGIRDLSDNLLGTSARDLPFSSWETGSEGNPRVLGWTVESAFRLTVGFLIGGKRVEVETEVEGD
jgi:hypothetical protein